MHNRFDLISKALDGRCRAEHDWQLKPWDRWAFTVYCIAAVLLGWDARRPMFTDGITVSCFNFRRSEYGISVWDELRVGRYGCEFTVQENANG